MAAISDSDKEYFREHPILGGLDVVSNPSGTISEGEKVTIFLHLGRRTVKPIIKVDYTGLSELGDHLEQFSGVEISDPESDSAWYPGKRISGIRNLKFGFIFITEVDGNTVAQESGFYNTEDNRER